MTTDDYRKGFIAGAVVGADLHHARWAIEHDMAAARQQRDDARLTNDQVLWGNVRFLIAEARMWSQIARLLLRQQRGDHW